MTRPSNAHELDLTDVLRTLNDARIWWISTAGAGGPHASPTWGVEHDGALWFFGAPAAVRSKNLDVDPRVVIHTEDGESPLIVTGTVTLTVPVDDEPVVVERYRAKYVKDIDQAFLPGARDMAGGSFYRIEPVRVLQWHLTATGAMETSRWRR